MQGNATRRSVKQLEAALATARATVATLEAALAATAEPVTSDTLDAREALAEFGVGRDGLLAAHARGELQLCRGPRQKILVGRDEIERWLRSRPVKSPQSREPAAPSDLESWERETRADLRALAGGRR
jgi:hypothetical protein